VRVAGVGGEHPGPDARDDLAVDPGLQLGERVGGCRRPLRRDLDVDGVVLDTFGSNLDARLQRHYDLPIRRLDFLLSSPPFELGARGGTSLSATSPSDFTIEL